MTHVWIKCLSRLSSWAASASDWCPFCPSLLHTGPDWSIWNTSAVSLHSCISQNTSWSSGPPSMVERWANYPIDYYGFCCSMIPGWSFSDVTWRVSRTAAAAVILLFINLRKLAIYFNLWRHHYRVGTMLVFTSGGPGSNSVGVVVHWSTHKLVLALIWVTITTNGGIMSKHGITYVGRWWKKRSHIAVVPTNIVI